MKNISLKQLKYFAALVKFKSFGLAADAVAISQPAISMQIKELEREVGAPLIERGGHQLILTELGLEFHQKALEVLEKLDDLTALSGTVNRRAIGRLRVGVIPTIAPYLIPDLIFETKKFFPELSLIFKETQTDNLLLEMREGDLDCSILALPVTKPGFYENHLFDENFLLVRNAKQKGVKIPDPVELINHNLLLLEEGHCFRDQAISFCGVTERFSRQRFDASSFTTLVHMVSAGLGVTLIPEMARKLETLSSEVIIDQFPNPSPKRSIGVIWRDTSPISSELVDITSAWKKVLPLANKK